MANRKLAYIVKHKTPVIVGAETSVQQCCHKMRERRAGAVLVIDGGGGLRGIFTGRDAVHVLARGKNGRMLVADAMTVAPVTLPPDKRAVDAIRAMAQGGFRHLPIVADGRVLGVVSRGDFAGMEFEEFNWQRAGQTPEEAANRPLCTIIESQRPLTLRCEETIGGACRAMHGRGCGSALVVDADGRLCGIFTGRDAVSALARREDAAAMPLQEAMQCRPLSLPPESLAIEALRTMSNGGFRHVPIVDGDRLVGVVSRGDFSALELNRLDEEDHLAECIW